jgi:beta-glucosidase
MDAYRDPTLTPADRAADLVTRLTRPEKLSLLFFKNPEIPRLGLPAYNWWNEGCHGVARSAPATVFPQTIALAASFDPVLVADVYRAVALEARSAYASAALAGKRGIYRGLTFWTPNINIFRDPRWGRGQETFGECPVLTATLGVAAVTGLQGEDPARRLLTAACAKHYAVHSGPEADRHRFDAIPTRQDLFETYLPAFEALVRGGVETVMGAYNRLYGEPCCASPLLITELLRGAWGFRGHVVSDCWALRDFHEYHKVTKDMAESAALALQRGLDLNCGCEYLDLPDADARGLIDIRDVDASVARLLECRIKLGQLDETRDSLAMDAAACPPGHDGHHALARRAAAAGLVLLKNNGVLPMRREAIDLYVVGPYAASTEILMGNYHGVGRRMSTVLEGLAGALAADSAIYFKPAFLNDRVRPNPIDWVTGEARVADVVVAVVGIDPQLEGEEGDAIASTTMGDRVRIELPEAQRDFVGRLAAECGKPVVLVVVGGSPIALAGLEDRCAAVVQLWYPGQAGGEGLADVLFGAVNPSGRLPVTVPRRTEDLPPFDDYGMQGRTYRFATAEPLYPFGFGLSYTIFSYDRAAVAAEGDALLVTAEVRNAGARSGDEVAQCYVRLDGRSQRTPLWQLAGIAKVRLQPGQSATVRFRIDPRLLMVVDPEGRRVREPGHVAIQVGGCSPGARGQALGAPAPATLSVRI